MVSLGEAPAAISPGPAQPGADGASAGSADQGAMMAQLLAQLRETSRPSSARSQAMTQQDPLLARMETMLTEQQAAAERLEARIEDVEAVVQAARARRIGLESEVSTCLPSSDLDELDLPDDLDETAETSRVTPDSSLHPAAEANVSSVGERTTNANAHSASDGEGGQRADHAAGNGTSGTVNFDQAEAIRAMLRAMRS